MNSINVMQIFTRWSTLNLPRSCTSNSSSYTNFTKDLSISLNLMCGISRTQCLSCRPFCLISHIVILITVSQIKSNHYVMQSIYAYVNCYVAFFFFFFVKIVSIMYSTILSIKKRESRNFVLVGWWSLIGAERRAYV